MECFAGRGFAVWLFASAFPKPNLASKLACAGIILERNLDHVSAIWNTLRPRPRLQNPRLEFIVECKLECLGVALDNKSAPGALRPNANPASGTQAGTVKPLH